MFEPELYFIAPLFAGGDGDDIVAHLEIEEEGVVVDLHLGFGAEVLRPSPIVFILALYELGDLDLFYPCPIIEISVDSDAVALIVVRSEVELGGVLWRAFSRLIISPSSTEGEQAQGDEDSSGEDKAHDISWR